MARVLYFDCFSGISGDMVLGAFLDAGLPLDDLKRARWGAWPCRDTTSPPNACFARGVGHEVFSRRARRDLDRLQQRP